MRCTFCRITGLRENILANRFVRHSGARLTFDRQMAEFDYTFDNGSGALMKNDNRTIAGFKVVLINSIAHTVRTRLPWHTTIRMKLLFTLELRLFAFISFLCFSFLCFSFFLSCSFFQTVIAAQHNDRREKLARGRMRFANFTKLFITLYIWN